MSLQRDPASDQRLPKGNDLPHTHDLAIGLLAARKRHGINKYGQPLQPANGRSFAQDAMEEAADLLAYLAGLVYETEHPEDTWLEPLLRALLNGKEWRHLDVPVPVERLLHRLDSKQTTGDLLASDWSWG